MRHIGAALHELFDNVAANIAGRAGYEDGHGVTPGLSRLAALK
jgi:hypothetical protein